MAVTFPRRTFARREILAAVLPAESASWIRIARAAMACRFEVTLSGEDVTWVPSARHALAEATRLDAQLSVFRDDSELSRVNRDAARSHVPVSRELADLLALCGRLSDETNGAFDITSTPLSRCWGFLARQGRVPPLESIEVARGSVGMDRLEVDDERCTVRFRGAGVELNLGSIGKGYAVGRITEVLAASGVRHALVSAGGSSVFALGGRGRGWAVDLSSRAVGSRPVARLHLRHAALATSGVGEQWVRPGSDQGQTGVRPGSDPAGTPRRYGHVIDPRTGWPAEGTLCVSVVAWDAATADALATAFLVGGEALARTFCAAHPDVLAVLTPDGSNRPMVVGAHPGAEVEEP